MVVDAAVRNLAVVAAVEVLEVDQAVGQELLEGVQAVGQEL